MELQLPSIPLLLASLLFIFMVAKYVKRARSKRSSTSRRLPPGPRKLPLIGNMHQLVGSLAHLTLSNLARKYGPLMHLQLGEVSTMIVSSPEIAKEVLKTHDVIFSQRPYFLASRILSYDSTNIVFSPYGDYWRQMRRICIMELLSPKRVQSFQAIREEEVSNLINSISSMVGKTPINLSKKIFSLTYGITARAAFGKKSKDQERFVSIMERTIAVASGFSIVDMYPSIKLLQVITGMRRTLEKMQREFDQILQNIVNEHRQRKGTETGEEEKEDLVDVLMRIQKQGDLEFPLTDDNIKAVVFDIFSAGSETSSTAVEWALSEMLRNPEVMKKAQAEVRNVFDKKGNVDETGIHELKYLNSVIKETLRLHPSAPLSVPRESSEKCSINGYEIPAKTKVLVNVWAIGRDPRYWSEAEKFDPDRFLNESQIDFRGRDFEYIPFGAGRRICPGISYALPNIELPLAQLLYHFDWELPSGKKLEELDMEEAPGFTVRRKHDLQLIPIPYDPISSSK